HLAHSFAVFLALAAPAIPATAGAATPAAVPAAVPARFLLAVPRLVAILFIQKPPAQNGLPRPYRGLRLRRRPHRTVRRKAPGLGPGGCLCLRRARGHAPQHESYGGNEKT